MTLKKIRHMVHETRGGLREIDELESTLKINLALNYTTQLTFHIHLAIIRRMRTKMQKFLCELQVARSKAIYVLQQLGD